MISSAQAPASSSSGTRRRAYQALQHGKSEGAPGRNEMPSSGKEHGGFKCCLFARRQPQHQRVHAAQATRPGFDWRAACGDVGRAAQVPAARRGRSPLGGSAMCVVCCVLLGLSASHPCCAGFQGLACVFGASSWPSLPPCVPEAPRDSIEGAGTAPGAGFEGSGQPGQNGSHPWPNWSSAHCRSRLAALLNSLQSAASL